MDSVIRFDIPRTVKSAQQQHGLRYSNYVHYRRYCTQRIRTLRVELGLTHKHKCVRKRPAKFTACPVTRSDVVDQRALELLLVSAERDWAHAMQLRDEAGEDVRSRKKFHVRSKLRRAIKWANNLQRVAKQDSVAAATRLEADAYMDWIKANLHFELKDFAQGKELYERSKRVCDFTPSIKFDQSVPEAAADDDEWEDAVTGA